MKKTETIALCSGSYDPLTLGHLAVIEQSSKLFDKVIVGIGINEGKKNRRYDVDLMKKAIEETLKEYNLNNVEVITYTTLTAKVAQKYHATHFVRGIRNTTDYHYEETLAEMNSVLSDGIPTIYFRAGKLSLISSSMVVELLKHGEDVSKYLPSPIYNLVMNCKPNK